MIESFKKKKCLWEFYEIFFSSPSEYFKFKNKNAILIYFSVLRFQNNT